MSVEIVKPVETKEERRARKAAKKQAKLESQGASDPGSSSVRPSLATSKSEFEVSQILTVEPDVADSGSKKTKRERAAKDVGDIAADSESSVKRSKKEKKEVLESASMGSSELEERRRRKAEKKALKAQKEAPTATSEASVVKKEKKNKAKTDLEAGEDGISKEPKPKKEKSNKAAESLEDKVEPAVSPEQDERKEKKAKKEKRKRDADTVDQDIGSSTTPVAESSSQHTPSTTDSATPAKKAKKDKKATGKYDFTSESIFADTELSEHGQKAIHYAYEHATLGKSEDGKGWKFSKGKQLWLMRHIWDQSEVPEKYVDLVIGYLKTVQGLGRTGLIDTAKKQIAVPEPVQLPVEKVDESTQQPDEKSGESNEKSDEKSGDLKQDQPRKVMFADSNEEGPAEKPEIAAGVENTVEDTAVRRDRAKRMLAAIGAR